MDKKLTLSLNAEVVAKAKLYAKEHEISLSRMIENYLAALTEKATEQDSDAYSPLVNRLIGVIATDDATTDHEEDYTDYLTKKYE